MKLSFLAGWLLILGYVLALLGCLQDVGGARVQTMPGKRSHSLVFHCGDGLCYHRNLQRGDNLYLRCMHFKSKVALRRGCAGRAVIRRRTGDLEHLTRHTTHSPDLLHAPTQALRRRILSRCRRLEYVSYRTIFYQERRG